MPFNYDVHALLTLASDVPLPELQAFARPAADLDSRIRLRGAGWRARRRRRAGDRLTYDEALGRFGFAIEVAPSGAIEIEVSPLLSRSPHVLYSKVVEPVLRWAFVREGWAMVHGACFADGNDAYLISAPADTGKTMTLLTLLRRYPQLAFLADDLCLVRADGSVLDFPKPMTLSRHTLPAVNSHVLSVRERATLAVQSRVHSRSTRRFAERLDRVGLPMATASAGKGNRQVARRGRRRARLPRAAGQENGNRLGRGSCRAVPRLRRCALRHRRGAAGRRRVELAGWLAP